MLSGNCSSAAQIPFEPCIPSGGKKVPDRPDWIHEIKHDVYRLIIQREGKRVRLWTRNGHDCSNRFPLIIEAALSISSRTSSDIGAQLLTFSRKPWRF
jgi:ATP-dependent DNA ligase